MSHLHPKRSGDGALSGKGGDDCGDAVEGANDDSIADHFGMHARHSWLNNASSTLRLPWSFRLKDQRDVVDKSINYPSGFQV